VSFPPGAVALGNRDLLAARPRHGEFAAGSGGAGPRRAPAPGSGAQPWLRLVFFFFPQYFLWFLAQNVLAKFIHILFHDVFSTKFCSNVCFPNLSLFLLFIFLYKLVYKRFHKTYSHSLK
jgi:hypothetical protein